MRVVGDLKNPSLKFEGLRCYRNPGAVNRSKKWLLSPFHSGDWTLQIFMPGTSWACRRNNLSWKNIFHDLWSLIYRLRSEKNDHNFPQSSSPGLNFCVWEAPWVSYLPSEFGVIIIILKIQFFFRLKNQVRDFWFVLFDRSWKTLSKVTRCVFLHFKS